VPLALSSIWLDPAVKHCNKEVTTMGHLLQLGSAITSTTTTTTATCPYQLIFFTDFIFGISILALNLPHSCYFFLILAIYYPQLLSS
jgi:hypothetical protein